MVDTRLLFLALVLTLGSFPGLMILGKMTTVLIIPPRVTDGAPSDRFGTLTKRGMMALELIVHWWDLVPPNALMGTFTCLMALNITDVAPDNVFLSRAFLLMTTIALALIFLFFLL